MDITLVCIVAVVSAVLSLFLKKYNAEYSIIISIVCGIVLLLCILSKISPAISQIKDILDQTKMSSEYISILFKSLGICFLTQFASDCCKDAGESAIASKVELAGKVMIVIISLPLFTKVTEIAINLIGS